MSYNQPMAMNRRSEVEENAGLALEDVGVYNEFQDIVTSPAINNIPEKKKTPKTEVAKLVLLSVLILAVIAAVVVMLANTLLGVQNHEHDETTMQERLFEQTKTINSLAEILAAKKEDISEQHAEVNELRENFASLTDEMRDLEQEFVRLKPYTACLTEHGNAIYTDGTCYFKISVSNTWYDAAERCASINASLASPRTEAQWRAVYDLTRTGSARIGFRQSPPDGPWVDMEGHVVTQNVEAKLYQDHTGYDCALGSSGSDWPKFVREISCTGYSNDMVCEK